MAHPTDAERQDARDRARTKLFNQKMRAERERQLLGSAGAASPVRRLDPRTLQVIEIIEPTTKPPAPYPPKPKRPKRQSKQWVKRAKPIQMKRSRVDFGLDAADPHDQLPGTDVRQPPWEE